MFTGIIEAVGKVGAMQQRGGDIRLRVTAGKLDLGDVVLPESREITVVVTDPDGKPVPAAALADPAVIVAAGILTHGISGTRLAIGMVIETSPFCAMCLVFH